MIRHKLGIAERRRVVEMLRCAADCGSLCGAGLAPRYGIEFVVWEAKRAVQSDPTTPKRYRTPGIDTERYRWLLLEAAMRVEERSWP